MANVIDIVVAVVCNWFLGTRKGIIWAGLDETLSSSCESLISRIQRHHYSHIVHRFHLILSQLTYKNIALLPPLTPSQHNLTKRHISNKHASQGSAQKQLVPTVSHFSR